MEITIDDKKISNFRDLVNSNSNFICKEYSNKDGKNLWNLICSCMDWLTVSVRNLQNQTEESSNIDVRVMNMFSLISSIDIVFESVSQLHRVFVDNRTLPFSGEKECFDSRLFDEDDNTYFKTIRACFGAHPVNLNTSGNKRFASWPFDSHCIEGELTVHLYSNKVNEDDLQMHLIRSELISFLIKQYNYIDVIASKINEIFYAFKAKLSNKLIESHQEPLKMLYILKSESEQRLDNDYYNSIIIDLIMIFNATLDNEGLQILELKFKKSLIPLIDEIKCNLQNIVIDDLKNEYLLSPKNELQTDLSYELGKFYSCIYGEREDPLFDYYLKRFNVVSNDKFNFSSNDSNNILFLKLHLMLNF